MIVYLRCGNNNTADSVFNLFTKAVETFGCPLRVRADRGTENTKVADYMIAQGGSQNCPFICGRSVHNQRIERLWRDLFTGCTTVFYNLFYFMEDNGFIDPDDTVELFCLQYVFIPRINVSLGQFISTWNYHPLRSASNKSPYQLWTVGRHPETLHSNVSVLLKFSQAELYGTVLILF